MKRQKQIAELMWPRLFRRFEGQASTLQRQLRDMLVHAVMEGYLSPGEALPSSRSLAQVLALSPTTVMLGLQALASGLPRRAQQLPVAHPPCQGAAGGRAGRPVLLRPPSAAPASAHRLFVDTRRAHRTRCADHRARAAGHGAGLTR